MATYSEFKNSKNIESIYTNNFNFDSKKKLNVSTKVIPQDVIDTIENGGVTSEQLISMGVPYFTYFTQITLHGIFDGLKTSYSFGYKNLILNKNKSLGVKYTAIDESKRKELAKMLKLVGISYYPSSTRCDFSTLKVYSKDNLELLTKFTKIAFENKDLFVGNVNLQKANLFGQYYLLFTLNVQMIRKENVIKLAKAFGWTEEMQIENDNKLKAERMEYENRSNALAKQKNEVTLQTKELLQTKGLEFNKIEPLEQKVYLRVEISCDYKTDTYYPKYTIIITKERKSKRENITYVTYEFTELDKGLEFGKNVDVVDAFDNRSLYSKKYSKGTKIVLSEIK